MTTRRRSGRRPRSGRPGGARRPGLLTLLVGFGLALVTACGSGQRPGHGPASGTPGPAPTPRALAAFLGNGVSFWDHGCFGLDRAELLPDAGAPGGTVLRVNYPKGSASPTASRDDNAPPGGTQAYVLLARPAHALTPRYRGSS